MVPLALSYKLLRFVPIQSSVSGLASHLPAPMGLRHTWRFSPVYDTANLKSKGIDGKWCLALLKLLQTSVYVEMAQGALAMQIR